MQITRYDGTRFITEEEIDREFTDHWVLIATAKAVDRKGYLVASADGDDDNYAPLSDIAIDELNSNAKVIYGCKERGGDFHAQLLG